jgi:hypothetical protein
MINLPMTAFSIPGYGEKLELTILEVFGFPQEITYPGGYYAKGKIEIKSGSYYVLAEHCFTTGELWTFKNALKACYKEFSGEVELNSTESELELVVEFSYTGKVKIRGSFRERLDIGNKLLFEFESDQTCMLSAIRDLERVEKVFGDDLGVRR